MPAARVADRSPMAHLPLRESARGGQHRQQTHHQQGKEQQQQQKQKEEEETETEQNQQQQQTNNKTMDSGKVIADKSEEQCQREREMCASLMQKREKLEEQLIARLDELKDICIAEGDLVGQLPTEIYKCLLPGETEPSVKRRVGTAFKFSQEVLTIRRRNSKDSGSGETANEERQMTQLEAEIELNRRIVAAAERLANDKSVNKSVRKKRRKDLQMAAQRLRGLEKGLHRMRLSSSKPDVSTMADGCGVVRPAASIGHQLGSGFSLNSLKTWPNFYHTFRMASNTKSCPATPRGSVPDLSMPSAAVACRADNANGRREGDKSRRTTPSTAKKLHKMFSRDHLLPSSNSSNPSAASSSVVAQHSELPPSSSSSSSLNAPHHHHLHHHPHPSASSSPSSSGISSATPSLSSSSNLLSLGSSTAPPVPSRRSSSGSSLSTGGGGGGSRECRGDFQQQTHSATATDATAASRTTTTTTVTAAEVPRQNSNSHIVGYQSTSPYKSAYRQFHFPTMLQQQQQTSSPSSLSAYHQPMTSSTSFSVLNDLSSSSSSSNGSSRPSCCCCASSCCSSSASLAAAASSQLGQIVRRLDAARPLRPPMVIRRSGGVGAATLSASVHGQAHSTGSLDRRLRRVLTGGTTTMPLKKVASTTATTTAICPSFFAQFSPPPRLSRTTAVEQLTNQLVTTFPASVAAERRDNDRAISQLLDATARFRSISAVLDKNGRRFGNGEMPFPRPNDRLEALLASIHRQSQVGNVASTAQNDGSSSPSPSSSSATTTTLV